MATKKTPVSVWGIEFDAMIEETKSMASTIPSYPVEDGFPVSDTIINDPVTISMTLYLTNTPVTWLHRHGASANRVKSICSRIEEKWLNKELTKIVTPSAIYTNMGIKSISIRHTAELGYAREIALEAQKVYVTEKSTVTIPSDILQGGATGGSGGTASTSSASATTSTSSPTAGNTGPAAGAADAAAKKSMLLGIANGLGFM